MDKYQYYNFRFRPLSAEVCFFSSIKTADTTLKFSVDALGQDILFINKGYAVCVDSHWRLSQHRKRVQSISLEVTAKNDFLDEANARYVEHWNLQGCVGRMNVWTDDSDNRAGCALKVWIPSRHLRILREQLLNNKLPKFLSVNFRTPLGIGTLDFGIAPDGSDKVLTFDYNDGIQVPIHSVAFGYEPQADTTDCEN